MNEPKQCEQEPQAFPTAGFDGPDKWQSSTDGMTLRCYIATACLQGLLATSDDSDVSNTPSQLSRYAITCADELLKQLGEK